MGEGEAVQAADPYADRASRRVLAGGGLPPGLLQNESGAVQVLRHRLRPLRPPRRAVGQPAQEVDRTIQGFLRAGSSPFACFLPTRSAFCIACSSSLDFGSASRAACSTLPESMNFFVRSL